MSVSVYNLSVTLSGVERPGPRWQQLAEDWLVQLPDRHRGEGCAYEREKERGVNGVEWTVFVCVWFRVQYMCTCWVALSSLRLSAGSVGFGADCDVTADPPPCGSVHLCVHLSLSLCPCVSQGRVVENISKRCGGFLRQLSLRGCLSVGDASMKWDSRCVSGIHWYKNCGSALTLSLVGLITCWSNSICMWLCLKLKQLVPLQSQGTFFFYSIKSHFTVSTCKQNKNNGGVILF